MRILFLVRSLDVGGAERQLVALARGLKARGHEVSVAVFYAGGRFEADLRSSDILVHDLGKRGRWEVARFTLRLAALVRQLRPDVLHAYMEANVFAAALKPLAPEVTVVWGIRSAKADFRDYGKVARLYPVLESALSSMPDGIIVNSWAARQQAVKNGLDPRKITVVPNGIDCGAFRPDLEGRATLRARWGVPDDKLLVGMVARLDPVKNHSNFIRAAARVAATRRDVLFVCVTDSRSRPGYREQLCALAARLGLGDRLLWSDDGKVSNAVYSALDVAVLASNVGESFPNVVGEAMACGKPVVTTDSGDAAQLVGDASAVAPPRDDVALARAMLNVLARMKPGVSVDERVRARIAETFSLEMLAIRTEDALERLRRASGSGTEPARTPPAGPGDHPGAACI